MLARISAVGAVVVVVVVLTGCDFDLPDDGPDAPDVSRSAVRDEIPETKAAPPQRPLAKGADGPGAATPEAAAELYARAYTNWSWRELPQTNGRVLAGLAAGELRAGLRANARELRDDRALERGRPENRGEQLAIDVQGASARRRTVWVVMNETASARGVSAISDVRTTVYRASVQLLDGRWYVTEFEAY